MEKLKVIDLFCGCGGLSQGFKMAGYDILFGLDYNEAAIETYNYNFGPNKGKCVNLLDYDVNAILSEKVFEQGVDVIIGGPPCQGFSSANRWGDSCTDERNKLFFEYLKFVDLLKPKVVVIENVRQIITNNNGYAKDQIYKLFEERGYHVNHCVLNAEDYSVPQKRKRNFFVMIKGKKFDFESLKKQKKFTVKDALEDLYSFEKNNDGKYQANDISNKYLKIVKDSNMIYNHYISYPTIETQEKMKHVPQGGNWRDIPPTMFKTVRNNRHSSAYKRLHELQASVTIDTGNAHSNYYHPIYNRIPTVREAARLQSFPDSFIFHGSKSEQYRQVGNAVPPLMAKALALAIKEALEEDNDKIIDLFCGCGGLSMGFEMAGFESVLAIDLWKDAIETYNYNRQFSVGKCIDISKISNDELKLFTGKCCGVVGGPPCQGFSTVGKREDDDPRNQLYKEYCRVVEVVQPEFFVLENVKGLLTLSDGFFKNDIIERFSKLGYNVQYKVLNASNYGVPQNRERVFFVGIKNNTKFEYPLPLDKKVTCSEAISDLVSGEYSEPTSDYQKQMRKNSMCLRNHDLTTHTEQTTHIISMIPDGGSIKNLPAEYWNIRKYNKAFQRMGSLKQANTVDTGHRNYFHYSENRIPTVRENARLQSFPDTFFFTGNKTSQYKQVGNAVPPLLAYHLAMAIKKTLKEG